MRTFTAKEKRTHTLLSSPLKEPGPDATATIADHRPKTVYQRQLQQTMDAHAAAKAIPLQRKTPKGSARFQQIAMDMGAKYGVDTSGLQATHYSAFPAGLNAEATIQGNHIHFAPGKDTDDNIRHEVAHAIDNTLNGTPKGDQVVDGQKIDTTREQAVDRMVQDQRVSHRTLRRKKMDHGVNVYQRKQLATGIDPEKLNVVGENHHLEKQLIGSTNKTRRAHEKEYAKAIFRCPDDKKCYWEEYEFAAADGHGNRLEFGDDPYLRFFFSLIYYYQVKTDSMEESPQMPLREILASVIKNGWRLKESVIHSSKRIPWDFFKRDQWLHEKKIVNMALKIYNTTGSHDEEERHTNLIEHIKDYLNKGRMKIDINNLERIVLNPKPTDLSRLLSGLSLLRSQNMDLVAAESHDTKGIWKVGELHVNDIVNHCDDRSAYNLVDLKTFDKIVENYLHRKYPKPQPDRRRLAVNKGIRKRIGRKLNASGTYRKIKKKDSRYHLNPYLVVKLSHINEEGQKYLLNALIKKEHHVFLSDWKYEEELIEALEEGDVQVLKTFQIKKIEENTFLIGKHPAESSPSLPVGSGRSRSDGLDPDILDLRFFYDSDSDSESDDASLSDFDRRYSGLIDVDDPDVFDLILEYGF